MSALALAALLACAGDAPDAAPPDETAAPDDGAADTAPACETGSIEGRVIDGAGGLDPFPDAVVWLQRSGDEPLQTRADDQGRWSAELPPGAWTIWGEDEAGTCISSQRVELDLAPCGEAEADLTIDQCL